MAKKFLHSLGKTINITYDSTSMGERKYLAKEMMRLKPSRSKSGIARELCISPTTVQRWLGKGR